MTEPQSAIKTFNQLPIGWTFDFISPVSMLNSFSDRCVKISNLKYRSKETGLVYSIGTIHCQVYHASE